MPRLRDYISALFWRSPADRTPVRAARPARTTMVRTAAFRPAPVRAAQGGSARPVPSPRPAPQRTVRKQASVHPLGSESRVPPGTRLPDGRYVYDGARTRIVSDRPLTPAERSRLEAGHDRHREDQRTGRIPPGSETQTRYEDGSVTRHQVMPPRTGRSR